MFKHLSVVLATILVAVTISCETDSSDNSSNDSYLPLSLGNKWTYEKADTSFTMEIKDLIEKGYENTFNIYVFNEDSAYANKNESVLLLVKDGENNWKRDRELLHYPLYFKQKWDYYIGKNYWITTVWQDDYNYECKAGKFFHCKMLHSTCQTETLTKTIEEIYAPEVGLLLKRVDNESDGKWDETIELLESEIK